MIIGIITIFGLTILADCNLNLNSSTTNNYSNTSIINEQSISNATNPIKVGTIGNETINLNITGFAANISQITNDTTSATTINEQQQIMRISLMSNGTNPENETQNKTDLTENISLITTTLPTEDSLTTTSTTINDQEQIIISIISNSTNPIKVENRTSENEALNLNITANTSQIINDTTMASENNSTTSPTTINGQERISLISPENETLNLNKTDLAANKSQIIEEETTLATEDSTTSSTIINDQEQIMRISLISNVTANTSQITTTTEEETTTTTSEDSSSTSQSNSDNEDSSEEEDDEEELDDDESPPGFGNNTDFAATLTSTSTAPINLTDDTILYANSSESSSVPVIDWRSKFDNSTTDDKKQTALLRRKNLKVLLEYLKSKDINRLVIDIEMSERYRKVAAALKNTIGLLQTLSIDNKDDK